MATSDFPAGTSNITPVVLLGPADPALRHPLVDVLSHHMRVECIDRREVFRRALRSSRYAVVVLYSRDQDGTPNEPLLAQAHEAMPGRPIVQILSSGPVSFPATSPSGEDWNINHYLLPAVPTEGELHHLSGFITELAGQP